MSNMISLPEEVEAHRDRMWRREPEARVEDAAGAERLIEDVGFCAAMTDSRRPGPSLYIAVCGRRGAPHLSRRASSRTSTPSGACRASARQQSCLRTLAPS